MIVKCRAVVLAGGATDSQCAVASRMGRFGCDGGSAPTATDLEMEAPGCDHALPG